MPLRTLGFPSRAPKSFSGTARTPGRWILVLAVTAAGGALAGCGHGTASPAGAAQSAPNPNPVATSAVTIDNLAFSPKAVTVKVGTTVDWTNRDEEPHTVSAEDGSFKSGTLAGNTNTFSRTFTAAGTFTYHCSIHPYMTGTVEVTR